MSLNFKFFTLIFAVLRLHTVHDDKTVSNDHAAAKHKLKSDHNTVSSCLLATGNDVISYFPARSRPKWKVIYDSEPQDPISY